MSGAMVSRQIQSKKRYVYSFIIGTAVFLLVFGISYSLSYFEFQRISNLQELTAYNIFEDKLVFSLFNEQKCSSDSFEDISRDLAFQGRIIDDLEKRLGKNNKLVLFRKRYYTLIELEHFESAKFLEEECNAEVKTILFFYSNEDKDIVKSEKVGKLISVVVNRNPGLLVYSFDINLESVLIDKLKETYNIENSPTIVINEEESILYPMNIEEIEAHL